MISPLQKFLISTLLMPFMVILGIPSMGLSQFVPGEVIVQFAQQTTGAQVIAQASQSTPPEFQLLTPIIDDLQSKTHLPLNVTQITSGLGVVVSVDTDILTKRIQQDLSTHENVKTIQILPPDPHQQKRFPSSATILLEFTPDSPEFATAHPRSDIQPDVTLTGLISTLETAVNLPLQGEAHSTGGVLLQINLQKLTLILVDRLQLIPDIQSAQPNYTATFR